MRKLSISVHNTPYHCCSINSIHTQNATIYSKLATYQRVCKIKPNMSDQIENLQHTHVYTHVKLYSLVTRKKRQSSFKY